MDFLLANNDMKKMSIILFIFCSLIPIGADELVNNSIQINILEFVSLKGLPDFYRVSIEYQRNINDNFNISFEPHIYYEKITYYEEDYDYFIYSKNNIEKIDTEIYNIGNSFGLIFKPNGRNWRGMYFGLYLDLSIVHRTYQEDYFIGLGNKFEIGYFWIFKNRFTITLGGILLTNIYIPLNENKYSYLTSIKGAYYGESPVWARIAVGYSF